MTDTTALGFMHPTTLDEAIRCAELLAESNMIPKNYHDKAGDILVAGQMGAELGVPWLQALQGICVINGNPSVWGDLGWALVTAHPKFEDSKERYDEETRTYHCAIKVKGRETWIEQSFSWADACQAGLNTKDTYTKYRRRMLQWRARSWAMRDAIPEALKGLKIAEEQIAIEADYEVLSDGAATKGMSGLKAAMAGKTIAGPKADSSQPEGSPEWWASLMRNCTSLAQLEKVGFELRAADPEEADNMRSTFENYHDALRDGAPAPDAGPSIEEQLEVGPEFSLPADLHAEGKLDVSAAVQDRKEYEARQ